ncbi:MAG: hypothetical protein LLG97_04380 [Deltaproteobacteria bacterium]|nr:hypothetical protein [Deltaproteobacteria bacterium]
MRSLKTAISIPEDIYRDAEDAARRMGMSRSRLYTEAIADYLNRYRKEDIKARLNEVHADRCPGVDPVLAAMQSASVAEEEW